ncbi:hypothetical protein AHiyo1_27590 [Arthrobacter sp. Hiyo1]|nr:hypothetical protein AHiyo1_27590 [Arthrobacter sp. Hiyo1]
MTAFASAKADTNGANREQNRKPTTAGTSRVVR